MVNMWFRGGFILLILTLLSASGSAYFYSNASNPYITGFAPPAPVNDIVYAIRDFNITINQSVNVTWYINGTEVFNETDVTNSSYTNESAALGTWNVTAIAENANGTDSKTWDWNVTMPPLSPSGAPGIISWGNNKTNDESLSLTTNISESISFNVTANQSVNVTWYINGTEVFNETDVTNSSYTNESAALGTWNVTAIAENEGGSAVQTWYWNVELQKIIYAWNFSKSVSWTSQNYSLFCCTEFGNVFNVSTDYSNGSVRSGLSGFINGTTYDFPNMAIMFWNSPNFTVNNTLSSAFLESDIKIANFTGAGTISTSFNWTLNRTFMIGNKTVETAVPYQLCNLWRCSYGDNNVTIEIDLNISSSYLVYLHRPDGTYSTIYPGTPINGTTDWETQEADVQPLNFLQSGNYSLVLATMLVPSNTSGLKDIEVLWNNPNLTLVAAPPLLAQPEPPAIVSLSPYRYLINETMPATGTFNITLNQPANVYWSLDGMMLKNDVGVNTSSFTGSVYGSVGKGAHTVTARVMNWNGSIIQGWVWYVATEVPPPVIYRWTFDRGVQAWTSSISNASAGDVSTSMEFNANDGQPPGSLSAGLSGNEINNSSISPTMTWSSPNFSVNEIPSSATFEFDIKTANFTGAAPVGNLYQVILKMPDNIPVVIYPNYKKSTVINSRFNWTRINITLDPALNFFESGNYSIQLNAWLATDTTNGYKNIEVLWDNPTLRLGDPQATVLEGNVSINGAGAQDNSIVEARSSGVVRGKDVDGTTNGYYNLALFYGNKTDNIEFFVDGNKADQTWNLTEGAAGMDIHLDINVSEPGTITNLTNTSYALNYINWTWNDPGDADFANVSVWLDGMFITNVSKGMQYYNASNLTPGTEHTISTRTQDTSGNMNLTWVNDTEETMPDTTPPASITNLTNTSYALNYINWTWNDPGDADFANLSVWLDGTFITSVTKGTQYYNATNLTPGTEHTISTRTQDIYGNMNLTWVNDTEETLPDTTPPASITNLTNTSYALNYINWTWDDPGDADFANVSVWLDGMFITSVTKGTQYYNATNLTPGTEHTISTRTQDIYGNMNLTWVNDTEQTMPSGTASAGTGGSSGGGGGNSGSGGGGGGGGGGMISPENFSNIEMWELREMELPKDQPILYKFVTPGLAIYGVIITANINAGIVSVKVEQLRNTSAIVAFPPQGIVYKNINIWVNLAPKYIEESTIKFKVNNSWLAERNIDSSRILMLHWDGKWNELPTKQVDSDANFTYYESTTDAFSPFAIVAKSEPVLSPLSTPTAPAPTPAISVPTGEPSNSKKASSSGMDLLEVLRLKMPFINPPLSVLILWLIGTVLGHVYYIRRTRI